jgi:hypothetical protein
MWFDCHMQGHMVWNGPRMKHGDPLVTKDSTVTLAKDNMITAASVSVETIENYWVTETSGNMARKKECWYSDCASTCHIWGE